MWRVQVSIKHEVITVMGRAPIEQVQTLTWMTGEDFDLVWGMTNEQQGNPANLEEAIITGVVIAVSNGSFQDNNGSAAWTIEGRNQEPCILGSRRTPGKPDDQSAYQSKLYGLWGIF